MEPFWYLLLSPAIPAATVIITLYFSFRGREGFELRYVRSGLAGGGAWATVASIMDYFRYDRLTGACILGGVVWCFTTIVIGWALGQLAPNKPTHQEQEQNDG